MTEVSNQQILEAIQKLSTQLQNKPPAASAAEILLSIVPIVGIIFGAVFLFFYFLWQYRQTREMIRTNQYQPATYKRLRTWSLLMGCLSTVVGLPMTVLFISVSGLSYAAMGGVIPFSAGLGFLLFYYLSGKGDQ